MVLSLTLDASQRLRAAAGAFQQLRADLDKQVTAATRDTVVPMAIAAVEQHADSPVTARIAHTGRYAPLRGVPGVAFGGTAPVTSTGTRGRLLVRGLEFGGGSKRRTFTAHSPRGKAYKVTRRVTRQFGPDRSERPRFVYPGVESIADEAVEAWLDVVEAAVIDAYERGS